MLRRFLALGALCAGVALAVPAMVQAVELTYNSPLPGQHVLNKQGIEPFAERVKRDSDGEVSFRLLAGGSVAKASANLDVIRDGIVNSGLVLDLYARKSLPVNTVISDLALLGTDPIVMSGAVSEYKLVLCEECIREMARSATIAMAYAASTPYTMMCHTKVDSLADMKDKKVRATSPWALMFKELGMVTVNVSVTEMYEAMQRGQVDCSSGADAWLKSYTLWDVAKFVIDYPMGTYHGSTVMAIGTETWADLSPKARQAIVRNLAQLSADSVFGYVVEKDEARAGARERGVVFVPPAPDLVAALEAYKQKEVERVIAQSEKAGVADARKEIETFLATVAKWQKIVDEGKGDRSAYVQALEREVYSRIRFD